MMEPNEHALMIRLFALQVTMHKSLFHLLVNTLGVDVKEFEPYFYVQQHDDWLSPAVREGAEAAYKSIAKALGLQVNLEIRPSPPTTS